MKVTKLKLGSRARRRFSRAGGAVGEGGLVDLGRLQWQCDCESSVLCPGSTGTEGPSRDHMSRMRDQSNQDSHML